MRRSNDPETNLWHLLPAKPGSEASFRWSNLIVISFLVFLVVGVFVAGIGAQLGHAVSSAAKVSWRIDKDPAPVNLAGFKNGYVSVIDPALPAVVNISSTKMVKHDNNFPGQFFNDPFFRQFFGDQFNRQPARPETEREYSLGSGVIVNPNGYIVTNNHVVSGASDTIGHGKRSLSQASALLSGRPVSSPAAVVTTAKARNVRMHPPVPKRWMCLYAWVLMASD
jgi:S1-C subfamily serine protease